MKGLLDLTNGNGKAILSWVQVGWIIGASFCLGIIYSDVQKIRELLADGVYTKTEIDKIHLAQYKVWASSIEDLEDRMVRVEREVKRQKEVN